MLEPENLELLISRIDHAIRNGEPIGPLFQGSYPTLDEYMNLRYNGYNPWRFNFTTTTPL